MSFEIYLRDPGSKHNISLSESEIELISYTPYLTYIFDDSLTKFIKNSGQYGISIGITTTSINKTAWLLDKIQRSSNVFHPVININSWRWISGNSSLTG